MIRFVRFLRVFLSAKRKLLLTGLGALLAISLLQWALLRPHTLRELVLAVNSMSLAFALFGIFGVSLGGVVASDYREEMMAAMELDTPPPMPETRIDIFYMLLMVGLIIFLVTLLPILLIL